MRSLDIRRTSKSANPAHIYVTREQIKDEFKRVMELHEEYYKLFEFTNYYLRLSLWDPDDQKRSEKFVNDPASWAFTEQVMQEAMEEMGLYYRLSKGEAAFYGPKVDFQFQTVLEKEFTVSTNQIDFAVPPRFNLRYTDRDGTEKTPFCIHRAPLGTHERFISFLIEHYGGAFPTWLAPVQVAILPVSEKFIDYARALRAKLRDKFVRADIDESDTVSKRIQQSAANKIPVVLVVGAREQENNSATVRRHGITEQRTMGVDTLIETITDEIRVRRHVRAW